MRIYLAGWTKETFYRFYCHKNFSECNGLQIIDPLKFADQTNPDLVLLDKQLMDSCDVLVAYISRASFGTVQEILYCYERDIPVFIITPKKHQKNPWLKHHTTKFFNYIDDCFDYLLKNKDLIMCDASKKKLSDMIPNKK